MASIDSDCYRHTERSDHFSYSKQPNSGIVKQNIEYIQPMTYIWRLVSIGTLAIAFVKFYSKTTVSIPLMTPTAACIQHAAKVA